MSAIRCGVAGAVVLGAVACGGSVAGGGGTGHESALEELQAASGSVASVELTTSTSLPPNPAPAVHVTLSDVARAQSVYTATLALPAMPGGIMSCPADFGVSYTLTFRDASGALVMTATLDPDGCEEVSVVGAAGAGPTLWTATDTSYWSTLAATLGIDEASIYPYEPPTAVGPVTAG